SQPSCCCARFQCATPCPTAPCSSASWRRTARGGSSSSRCAPPWRLRRSNGYPHRRHVGFGFGDGELAEVEDRGGENGVGLAVEGGLGQVVEGAGAAAGDDGEVTRLADGAGELDVVAVLGAVTVHRRKEDLARAEALALGGP